MLTAYIAVYLQGQALAYNCMGVDCFYSACPPGANPEAVVLTDAARRALARATAYHQRHLELADDSGRCIAHSNLGLCASLLGKDVNTSNSSSTSSSTSSSSALSTAAAHHQEALRAALRLRSAAGQSVAVGNLGLLALRGGDAQTAQACLQQHLQLAQGLGDREAEVGALQWLGGLAGGQGDHSKAVECYEAAAALCKARGAVSTLKRLHCCIGVARGEMTMQGMFEGLLQMSTGVSTDVAIAV
jgi:tetratricopeptide (TPR) repeat protein